MYQFLINCYQNCQTRRGCFVRSNFFKNFRCYLLQSLTSNALIYTHLAITPLFIEMPLNQTHIVNLPGRNRPETKANNYQRGSHLHEEHTMTVQKKDHLGENSVIFYKKRKLLFKGATMHGQTKLTKEEAIYLFKLSCNIVSKYMTNTECNATLWKVATYKPDMKCSSVTLSFTLCTCHTAIAEACE